MSSPPSSLSFARQRIIRQKGEMRIVSLLPNSARGRLLLGPLDPASNCKTGLTGRSDDSRTGLARKDL